MPRPAPALGLGVAAVLAWAGCVAPAPLPSAPRELAPAPDTLATDDPLYAAQPHRERPAAIVLDARRGRLWVALAGTESAPARTLVELDAATLVVRKRVEVGPFPVALAIHPAGRHLVVLNRFARYASVVDLEREAVVGEVPTPYYSEAIAFDATGTRAFVANRWRDAVLRWDVRVDGDRFDAQPEDDGTAPYFVAGIRTLANPRRVLVADGGRRIFVTSESELGIAAYDADTGAELARHFPNAPVTDATLVGDFVIALHTGSGSGHPPDTGRDGDHDGLPGDGTANVVFQDVQNEIDVLAAADLRLLHRYTSDSIAFHDFRDVDPDEPSAGLALPPADTWPPSRAAFLPPRDTWIVAGAMPERVIPFDRTDGRHAVAVVFGGSSEVQTFDVSDTGALAPHETGGGLYATGMGAMDAALVGRKLVVVSRLGEELTAVALDAPPAAPERVVVGDVSGGPFPSTDAELGEAFNTLTALFTVDGDQTCVHCHREGSPIGKDVSMPLLVDPANGTRLVMSYRGASDTRPWFFEAAMDDGNFFPVINEFARRENFCCEQTDTRIWGALPTRAACDADPTVTGCHHVLACEEDPPPACATRRYGSPYLTRDAHFRAAAIRVFGRDTTFGDVLYTEHLAPDGTIERRPIPLGFDGITGALGVFLRAHSRLLPNPNAALPSADVRRGALLFASSEAGCASCHPLPTGAIAVAGPISEPQAMPFVVSPLRDGTTGVDLDRVSVGFLRTFPRTRQDETGLRIGVTSVRGAWDRVRFLHHGAARSVREVIATPGHPGLAPGETGHNERDGVPDTHGGASQLRRDELAALAAFVDTL